MIEAYVLIYEFICARSFSRSARTLVYNFSIYLLQPNRFTLSSRLAIPHPRQDALPIDIVHLAVLLPHDSGPAAPHETTNEAPSP